MKTTIKLLFEHCIYKRIIFLGCLFFLRVITGLAQGDEIFFVGYALTNPTSNDEIEISISGNFVLSDGCKFIAESISLSNNIITIYVGIEDTGEDNCPFNFREVSYSQSFYIGPLSAGNYCIEVVGTTLASGVDINNLCFTVVNACNTFSIEVVTSPATCNQQDGSANIELSDDQVPYTILWSNGGNSLTVSNLSAGSYTVTVTNAQGCTTESTIQVIEQDEEAPTLSNCPDDIVVRATSDGGAVVNWTTPTATDNCSTPTLNSTHNSGTFFSIDFTPVTITALDASGNATTCSFAVTVEEDVTSTCHFQDSLALVELYNATGGENWTYSETATQRGDTPDPLINAGTAWNFDTPISTWHGVVVNEEGCVERLLLHNNGLTGTLPDLNLPMLIELNADSNAITGNIPDFTFLQSLEYLDLSENDLSGQLLDFQNMPNLEIMDIRVNNLTGIVPDFTALPELIFLQLRDNKFSGQIPNFSALPSLLILQVDINEFDEEIPDFEFIPLLEQLDIGPNNKLPGTIPDFSNLPNLERLDLTNIDVEGGVPNFTNLPNLNDLEVDNNTFTFEDLLSSFIALNTQIIQNAVDSNDFYRYYPQDRIYTDTTFIVNEGETLSINLGIDAVVTFNTYVWYKNGVQWQTVNGENLITFTNIQPEDAGTYVVEVSNPQLPELTLESYPITIEVEENLTNTCRFQDSLALVEFYNATGGPDWTVTWDLQAPMNTWEGVETNAEGCVTELKLRDNNLTGSLIDLQLPSLVILDVGRNELSGPIPDFSNLPELVHLDCGRNVFGSENSLTGSIPDFSNLPKLEYFDCDFNELTGSIPNFSNLPRLIEFSCSGNELSGIIPNFSNLPNLEELWVSHNDSIRGNIPDFANLPKLRVLSCGDNQLTGFIPDFSNIPEFTSFFCSENQLNGAIPDFSNIPRLFSFWCDKNMLTGDIPDFSNLDSLSSFRCEDNLLEGSIPDFTNIPQLRWLDIGQNQLEGNIPDFSNLPNLGIFDCEDNLLTGVIPDFTNLANLRTFRFGGNELSGNLPNFANLPNLEELDGNNNQLTGRIPDLSDNCPLLERMVLANNNLQGCFPDGLTMLCPFGLATSILDEGYNFLGNPGLPWGGDFERFCNGEAQIGSTCDDGDPNTENDVITEDCACAGQSRPPSRLFATEAEGLPGETICVPIVLQDLELLATIEGQIVLENPAIGTIIGLEDRALSGVVFNPDNGRFSYLSASGLGENLSVNDTLFCLQIELTGQPGDSSLVNFADIEIWTIDGSQVEQVEVTTEVGIVRILNNFIITGNIYTYWEAGIKDVLVEMETENAGDIATQNYTTAADGVYRFEDVAANSNCLLTPSKGGIARNGLSTASLFLAQRFILNYDVSLIASPFQIVAGDANCDGRLSTIDLLLIQRVIVEIDDAFSFCPNWKFTPATEAANFQLATIYYPGFPFPEQASLMNLTEDVRVDFIGVKTGDILGRANPANFNNILVEERAIRTLPVQLKAYNQTERTVDIQLTVAEAVELASWQLGLAYDTNRLQFESVRNPEMTLAVGEPENGKLLLSWFSESGLDKPYLDKETLLTLRFRLHEKGSFQNSIWLDESRLAAEGFLSTGTFVQMAVVDDKLPAEKPQLLQNRPNPTDGMTIIPFYVPTATNVTLVMHDQLGRVMHYWEGNYKAGWQAYELSTKSLSAGIYSYTLQTPTFTATKSMIVTD